MRFSLRTLLIVMLLGGPVLAIAIDCLFSESGSNCGGNNAARSDVGTYSLIANQLARQSSSGEFSVTKATPDQLLRLAEMKTGGWTRARYLVSVRPLSAKIMVPRYILCVCDRAYTNVPRQRFGTARPTHAVAYSDGSTQFISVAEFHALPHSEFVAIDELIGR